MWKDGVKMKKKFDISEYDDSVVMHCTTEEEAKVFCNFLHSQGLTWKSGKSYAEFTNYKVYKHNTCYRFNCGTFGDLDEYIDEGFYYDRKVLKVLEFSDFCWDENQTPDFCTTKESDEFLNSFLSEYVK